MDFSTRTRMLKHKYSKIEAKLGAEEKIPVLFFGSKAFKAVISSGQVKISSTSKTCDKSDYVASRNRSISSGSKQNTTLTLILLL